MEIHLSDLKVERGKKKKPRPSSVAFYGEVESTVAGSTFNSNDERTRSMVVPSFTRTKATHPRSSRSLDDARQARYQIYTAATTHMCQS